MKLYNGYWWTENRKLSYLMGGYHQSLKSKRRTKDKKYECRSKIVLYTISKESFDISCRYWSLWINEVDSS